MNIFEQIAIVKKISKFYADLQKFTKSNQDTIERLLEWLDDGKTFVPEIKDLLTQIFDVVIKLKK